jgi:antitoxin component YwqK of YwqJK toxin-antitoxin module
MPRQIYGQKIVNGAPEGKAEIYDSNSRVIQKGVFAKGKLSGVACEEVKYNANFEVTSYYKGAMENGKYHGAGILYEGVMLKNGNFVNGVFSGIPSPTTKEFTLITNGFGDSKIAVAILDK